MTIKINLGKQYKPGETIPKGEPYWYKYGNNSSVYYPNGYYEDFVIKDNRNSKHYRAPKIEFVLPKEPKPGEWWEVRDVDNGCLYIMQLKDERMINLYGGVAGHIDDFEFIRRWEPCDE